MLPCFHETLQECRNFRNEKDFSVVTEFAHLENVDSSTCEEVGRVNAVVVFDRSLIAPQIESIIILLVSVYSRLLAPVIIKIALAEPEPEVTMESPLRG